MFNLKPKIEVTIFSAILIFTVYIWLSPEGIRDAPDIDLTTLTGAKLNPSKLNNKPVLVTFWATNCTTCMHEVPDLKKMHADYHKQGFQLIAVSMYYDRPDRVNEVVKLKKMPYHIVFDTEQKIMSAFDMKHALTPTSFLISPNGRIVYHKIGKIKIDRLRRKIELMLANSKS